MSATLLVIDITSSTLQATDCNIMSQILTTVLELSSKMTEELL